MNGQGLLRFAKHLAGWLVSLIFGLLLVQAWVNQWLLPKASHTLSGKLWQVPHFSAQTIPIVGSSRARCSYVPSLLGHETFNLGRDGTGPKAHLALLDYLVAHGCDTILYSWDWWRLSHHGDALDLLVLPPSEARDKLWASYPDTAANFPVRRWPLIRLHGYYTTLIQGIYESDSLSLTYDRGYQRYINPALPKPSFEQMTRDRIVANPNIPLWVASDPDYFNLLFNWAKSHPMVKLLVVWPPDHASSRQNLPRDQWQRMWAAWQRLGTLQNVRQIDCSQLAIPDYAYEDTYHLNPIGAKLFSIALQDSLAHILQ